MRYRILIFVYAVLLGLSLTPQSRAQSEQAELEEPKLVVRTYPVADLIDTYAAATGDSTQWPGNRQLPASVSNNPSVSGTVAGLGGGGFGGGMGGMGGGMGGGGMFQVTDVTVKNPTLSQMGEMGGDGAGGGMWEAWVVEAWEECPIKLFPSKSSVLAVNWQRY